MHKELAGKGRIVGNAPKIWLCVPLIIQKEVLGVMAVQSYTNPRQFTHLDLDVLSFVSGQIALSLRKKGWKRTCWRSRNTIEPFLKGPMTVSSFSTTGDSAIVITDA
jgi:signal transduction protein with GAF and PtsI domain